MSMYFDSFSSVAYTIKNVMPNGVNWCVTLWIDYRPAQDATKHWKIHYIIYTHTKLITSISKTLHVQDSIPYKISSISSSVDLPNALPHSAK